MFFRRLPVLLGLWLVAFSTLLHAQADKGAIRGTVIDAEFGVPVGGAIITSEPGGAGATADAEGRFTLSGLNAGSYQLMASRDGYVRARQEGVIVIPGMVKDVQISMVAEVMDLDEFVVNEEDLIQDSSATNAVSLAAKLDNFATALNPSLMKAGGSTGNIGDALKRQAGTAVVDSRYVVVRGLSDRYNVVVLNGARLPSSDPDKRAVNIDIFPSGLIETLVSSKTFTPNLPGETTGGYINIITKRVPAEPFLSFSTSIGYNTQATGNPNFLSYRGAGTGFLGTGRDRQLPGYLKATTKDDLPFEAGGYNEPPTSDFDVSGKRVSDLRQQAARSLAGRSMGVSTKEAPMNFGFSAIGGKQVEFGPGPLGIIAGVTYGKKYEMETGLRGAVNLASGVPQLTELMNYSKGEESLLAGALLGLSLDISDDDRVAFTWFTNIAAEDEATFQYGENSRVGTVDNGIPLSEENIVVMRENLTYTERRLQTFQFSGEHKFPDHGDIAINWVGAFSMSSQDQPDVRNTISAYDFALQNYTSPGDVAPPSLERVWRRLDDTNYNIAIDVEVPWGNDPVDKERSKFRFGGSMDHSTRDYETDNFQYVDNSVAIPGLVPALKKPSPNDADGLTLSDSLGIIDQTDQQAITAGGLTSYSDIVFLSRARDLPPGERYTATQTIPAFFGSTTFNITDQFEVVAGARVEHTDLAINVGTTVETQFLTLDPETGLPIPADKLQRPSIVRTDLLPSIAAKWSLADDIALRGSISRTVARPTFKELAPVFARDPETGDFFVGNVLLEMSSITNYDTRVEWNMSPSDQVVLSFFGKQIKNPIESVNLGVFDTVRNDESASLYGFEIEFYKKLDSLFPGLLDNFTFGLNYGRVISRVDLRRSNEELRRTAGLPLERPLQGQPDYTFNANLTYDDKDAGLSAGILLNVTGPLLYQVGGNQGTSLVPDVYQRTYTSLDLNLSKEIWDGWKVGFRVSNLLNSRRERYYPGNLPQSVVTQGTIYTISLSKDW